MRYFFNNQWIHRAALLIFSLQVIAINSMEHLLHDKLKREEVIKLSDVKKRHVSNEQPKLEETVQIFDSKKAFKERQLWDDLVPSNMIITPDGKGLVMSECGGKVRYADCNKTFWDETHEFKKCYSQVVVQHSCSVKHFPIIALAQKSSGQLLIVSAGNYTHEENDAVSEYILFFGGMSKKILLKWPIQAISIDPTGTYLAIAGEKNVKIFNCESDTSSGEAYLKPIQYASRRGKDENWIVDIAIKQDGSGVAVIGSQGELAYMIVSKMSYGTKVVPSDNKSEFSHFSMPNISLGKNFSNLKQIVIDKKDDNIKKIYYSGVQELWCVTTKGKAEIIDLSAFMADNDEFLSATEFAKPSWCNMCIVDQSGGAATAHWTNNKDATAENRRRIKIYRKGKELIEKFILMISDLDDSYSYITQEGKRAIGIAHILQVGLRDKSVCALATDGKMRMWSLPGMNAEFDEGEKKESVILSSDVIARRGSSKVTIGVKKRHSSSAKSLLPETSDFNENGERNNKKGSPRINDLIKSFKSSKENSPVLSRENSPSRGQNNNEGVTVEAKEVSWNHDDKQEIKTPRYYGNTL